MEKEKLRKLAVSTASDFYVRSFLASENLQEAKDFDNDLYFPYRSAALKSENGKEDYFFYQTRLKKGYTRFEKDNCGDFVNLTFELNELGPDFSSYSIGHLEYLVVEIERELQRLFNKTSGDLEVIVTMERAKKNRELYGKFKIYENLTEDYIECVTCKYGVYTYEYVYEDKKTGETYCAACVPQEDG